MNPATVATVIIAVTAVIGLGVAAVGWFYKRGGAETAMSVALDRNTTATDRLTEKLEGVVVKLHDHDIRLTRLETKNEAPQNGRAPTDRDAGTPSGHQAR